jgi:hypothetical protein
MITVVAVVAVVAVAILLKTKLLQEQQHHQQHLAFQFNFRKDITLYEPFKIDIIQ